MAVLSIGSPARARMTLTPQQSLWFDATRGLAAVAVLAYHVRYRFFADWSEVPRSAATFAFYTITSFGHDAVMVFFVLSGALISRSVMRATAAGRWSWTTYATARVSRLYVVLIPGLLLTLAWDVSGLMLFPDHPVYTGHPTGAWHDFFDVRRHLGFATLVGNALFLQAILVPTFGSNAPLWSLSFEFWYYVLFPLLWCMTIPTRPVVRVLGGAGALAVGILVGNTVMLYFPLWLAGALLWVLPSSRSVARWPRSALVAAATLFTGTLLAGHSILSDWPLIGRDYLIGLTFVLVLYVILHLGEGGKHGPMAAIARSLAGQSYTLYVVHVPLLVFLKAWLGGHAQWQPSARTIALATALTLGCLVYSHVVAQLTEARTDGVRRRIERWLGRSASGHAAELARQTGSGV